MCKLLENIQFDSKIDLVVHEGKAILEERYAETLDICAVAKELGVGYSYFRRAFKELTGYSPWQYVLNLRLATTCRLLITTDVTLEEIAAQVGFSSSFYLSSQFKKTYGHSPINWKRRMQLLSKKLNENRVLRDPMGMTDTSRS